MLTQEQEQQPRQQEQSRAAQPASDLLTQVIDSTERELRDLNVTHAIAKTLAASQFFQDATSISQASVKIMAGRELGIPPIASMMSIDVIKGKVRLSGALIGALLQRRGYSWTFKRHDAQACVMQFSHLGQPLMEERINAKGEREKVQVEVSFTIDDAKRAGLTNPTKSGEPSMYEKYPRNMLFNRCITNFQRWHDPAATAGLTVLTEDEAEEITATDPVVTETAHDIAIRKVNELRKQERAEKDLADEEQDLAPKDVEVEPEPAPKPKLQFGRKPA